MNFSLSKNGNVYEQIVAHFKRYIRLGVYQNDEMLPSCRNLAYDLGINPNTVNKAYAKLEEDGFVIAVPKKGYIVAYKNQEDEVVKQIKELKENGISYEELLAKIKEVYEKWLKLRI